MYYNYRHNSELDGDFHRSAVANQTGYVGNEVKKFYKYKIYSSQYFGG